MSSSYISQLKPAQDRAASNCRRRASMRAAAWPVRAVGVAAAPTRTSVAAAAATRRGLLRAVGSSGVSATASSSSCVAWGCIFAVAAGQQPLASLAHWVAAGHSIEASRNRNRTHAVARGSSQRRAQAVRRDIWLRAGTFWTSGAGSWSPRPSSVWAPRPGACALRTRNRTHTQRCKSQK